MEEKGGKSICKKKKSFNWFSFPDDNHWPNKLNFPLFFAEFFNEKPAKMRRKIKNNLKGKGEKQKGKRKMKSV